MNGVYEYGLTSYLGVSGLNSVHPTGLLFLDSSVQLQDVRDGTSNTLLIGERPPSGDFRFGWWHAGKGQRHDGEGDSVLGVRTFSRVDYYGTKCTLDPYHFAPGLITNPCSFLHFWSLHSGGAHFVLADGSVRFLAYSVDPILPALASRAGGESASLPD